MKPVETDDLKIHFEMKRCIHARQCFLGAPKVFDPRRRPWIDGKAATTEQIVAVIDACPSGALSYERKDGKDEAKPATNTARVWENGPVELRGDFEIEGHGRATRAMICRCGLTKNPPFCDDSHRGAFEASGLPGAQDDRDVEMEVAEGAVDLRAMPDGPVLIKGAVEVIDANGSRVARVENAGICRCGASGKKPFCDGTHRTIGFEKAGTGEA